MPRGSALGPRPGPQDAYARWLDACASAGWINALVAEQVPVGGALGRVAAAQVRARWPVPRYACAAMDGIAMAAGSVAALADAPGPGRLGPSSFAWIDTGDPIPPGLDTVVQRERVELGADGSVLVTGPVPAGLNVRARGEDFPAGQLLIPAGRRLRPADLAVAAAAGYPVLEVVRRPVVAVIPTGDEVRPAGTVLRPGEVTDSNSLMLAARASERGAQARVGEVQPDRPGAIVAAVMDAAVAADLVLVIAGSSVGRRDHAADVLTRVGGLAVHGVAVRPGHPVLLGYAVAGRERAGRERAGREQAGRPEAVVPVIGVPGYPLAAAVIFELFAVPLIAALQGEPSPDRAVEWAQLACDWTSSPDVEDWVPVSLTHAPGRPDGGPAVLATPSRRGAGAISRLVRADAWWPIPIGQAKFIRGEIIGVHRMPGA